MVKRASLFLSLGTSLTRCPLPDVPDPSKPQKQQQEEQQQQQTTTTPTLTTTSVSYPFATLLTNKTPPTPPTVGAVVTAKVIKTNVRTVNLEIAPTPPLTESFSGLLRTSDVRSSDIDSIELHRCFRPGDIVRARVLSLGDQRAYYLTTAEEDLGVIKARSGRTGRVLVPLDCGTVGCAETGEKEVRKAAVRTQP